MFCLPQPFASSMCLYLSAKRFLPLRVGGYYNAEELSMNSEKDFPFLEKVSGRKVPGRFFFRGASQASKAPRHALWGGLIFDPCF